MKIIESLKEGFSKYKHACVFSYFLLYMPWFCWLEKRTDVQYYVIHSSVDDLIPFCEYFIIPYLLWFLFIAGTGLYLFFKDVDGFYKYAATTVCGMTVFLIICTVLPNAIHLRPYIVLRNNPCMDLVRMVWRMDTPTNVFPSLHVYNSLCAATALCSRKDFKKPGMVKGGTVLLTVMIILSTMFLKQHSVIDVMGGICMASFICSMVYASEPRKAQSFHHQPV